jgi:UDP-N-acetylglucosamine 2-epimerase (non-hydrolysing)
MSNANAGDRGIVPLDPLGYLEFLSLNDQARIVLTDSGGVQEETTVLGVPCLTLRENTERPATVEHGTNEVVGVDSNRILAAARSILQTPTRQSRRPPLWDGKAAPRIVAVLQEHFHRDVLA